MRRERERGREREIGREGGRERMEDEKGRERGREAGRGEKERIIVKNCVSVQFIMSTLLSLFSLLAILKTWITVSSGKRKKRC